MEARGAFTADEKKETVKKKPGAITTPGNEDIEFIKLFVSTFFTPNSFVSSSAIQHSQEL